MPVPLPPVLAGPLVRRVDPRQAHLWIATAQRFDVTAEVFTLPSAPAERRAVLLDSQRRARSLVGDTTGKDAWSRTVRLGARLFVTLCRVTPKRRKRSLPLDELLFYDLRLDGKDLSEFGLLGASDGITYGDAPLPAFFIPGKLKHLLHGSCHKLHGGGQDALTFADHRIAQTFEQPGERPALLFLTGDQIYADDVSGEISAPLAAMAEALLGYDELLPGRPRTLTSLQPAERGRIALEDSGCGFTSSEADHHAFGLGELAALHLLSWSPSLWGNFPVKGAELAVARAASVRIRRALANVSSYMVFDDHDVTDDWNLDPVWTKDVSSLPAGRRVVANALAAYWAFQGWGNDPDAFDSRRFVTALEGHLRGPARPGAFDDLLWRHARWSYATPTDPIVVALDVRTRRATSRNSSAATEPLAPKDGYRDLQTTLQRAGFKAGQPLILVSPLPVIGFAPVEALQRVHALPERGERGADWEGWPLSHTGRPRLLRFLRSVVRPSQCIILSGDVHYGFAASAIFSETGRGDALALLQLTASSLKNESEETLLHERLGPVIRDWPFGSKIRAAIESAVGAELSDAPFQELGWGFEVVDPPPGSGRLDELRAELGRTVEDLRGLPGNDPLRPPIVARQARLVEELKGIETLLRQRPVILTPDQGAQLKTREEPNWRLLFHYVPFQPGNLMAVGRTNLGSVRLDLPGSVRHALATPEGATFRVLEQALIGKPVVKSHDRSLLPPGQ